MKTISIEIYEGSFTNGFPAMLRAERNGIPVVETPCRLPPSQTVLSLYEEWRQSYQSLGFYLNSKGRGGSQTDVGELLPQCRETEKTLRHTFTDWLMKSEDSGLQRLREGLLRVLENSAESQEEVRIFLRTQDLLLQKLPWQEWDLLANYRNAEIVLSMLGCKNVKPSATDTNSTGKIRILVILGKDDGINTRKDLTSLRKSFTNVEIVPLSKPTQEQLNAELWDKHKRWDILFFTGHGTPGQLAINNTDRLDFDDLKHGLTEAIDRGLQLAIFNSCNGLELANQLVTELGIPQVIAMRELVPNLMAQRFLKYFLENLVDGKTVGFALREAQRRLTGDGFEKKFPGATWLPVVCQHPAKPSFSCKDRMSVTVEKSYLLIALTERRKGSSKYNVKAWLFKEDTVQNMLGDEGNGITLERVPALVVKLLGDLLHLGHSPTIEFLLPTDLLNHPVEEWRPSNNTLPIGVNHWVTIRSLERLEMKYNHEQLRQHWQKTVSRKFDKSAVAYNNGNFTTCLGKRFIFFSFNTTPELEKFEKLVPACVPMAMWIRCDTSKERYEKLLCKLENCGLEEVPEMVRKERVSSWDNYPHLGHISLFWDDPNRIPPDFLEEYDLEIPM